MTAGPARPVHPRAGRWLLLGALIIGLLAMLFLSGRDSAGHHRVLAPTPAAVGATQPDTGSLAAVPTSAHEPSGDGHAFVAGWAVLLLVAATGAVAGALRRRHTEHRPAALQCVRAGGLRGPPPALSRRALCVDRI